MNKTLKIFYGCWLIAIIATMANANAATTARPTLANTSANRIASTATRTSSTATGTQSTTTTTVATKATEPVITTPEPEPEKVIIVDNKTSMFDDILAEIGVAATDSSANELAETIRRQRALLDAQSERDTATGATSGITTANACDRALRDCMTEKCGQNFTKCNKDSTTAWGNKMDSCRRQTKCTGHEYTLLAPEILADRNAYNELAFYQSVVNCGNKYNDCIFTICGTTLGKCLSKSAGDSAIAKCKSIADECKEQDSGLAARVMDVFGDNRKIAATEAQKQEKRLYELRDLMRAQCQRFGAMFDERTLDCVYTVNFFVDQISTESPMASKKLYAGQTFQCTPDWFGIDVTTYLENAQRLTRAQTGAAAAAAGAGVGTAAGLWSSSAVTRAMDTQNAEKQAKDACEAEGGEWVSAGFNQGKKCDMTNAKKNCKDRGGTWDEETGCTKPGDNESLQTTDLSTGGGSNPTETPENTPQIGKKCGNDDLGTWTSCDNGFCGETCYDSKTKQTLSCACVQTTCLNQGKLGTVYTVIDDNTGEPIPFARIECDGSSPYGIDSETVFSISGYTTNFYGEFCLEKNIKDNAHCTISCIGFPPLVGTMKELKAALKQNNNKLTMCFSCINLKTEHKFGTKYDELEWVSFYQQENAFTHTSIRGCNVNCGKGINVTEEYDTGTTTYEFHPAVSSGTKCTAKCPGYETYTFTTKSHATDHYEHHYLTPLKKK